MSDKQSNLTDKETEDLQSIVTDALESVCGMADKHNIDRDSMLKYLADMLTAFVEVASIQNYETNHTCNCQHNSNSRDNEPCCRCDSRRTNADRIRNMSDKELVELITGLSKECLAGIGECDCSAHKTCTNCNVEVRKWLQSEAKQSRRKEDEQ